MKTFKVRSEYIDKWTSEALDELTVDEEEIRRLSKEWDVPVENLMEQVEEI